MIGDCAPLQVSVTNRSGSISCVGDVVTYTCTVPSIAHQWNAPSLGVAGIITMTLPAFPGSGEGSPSVSLTSGDDPITTALSVTSFAGLNGADITCFDALIRINETQDSTAMVFGKCLIIIYGGGGGGGGGGEITNHIQFYQRSTLETASFVPIQPHPLLNLCEKLSGDQSLNPDQFWSGEFICKICHSNYTLVTETCKSPFLAQIDFSGVGKKTTTTTTTTV